MIPVPDTITVTKASELDDWGQPLPGQSLTIKCRIDQTSKLVRSQDGKEVVASAVILMLGLVQIRYSDLIEWVDEARNNYAWPPLVVAVIRDLNGKPILTKVVV